MRARRGGVAPATMAGRSRWSIGRCTVRISVVDVASDAVVTAFGLAMLWYATELAWTVWNATLPTLGLPGAVEYAPLALGGLLIALFGAERLLAHLVTGRAPEGVPEHTVLTDA